MLQYFLKLPLVCIISSPTVSYAYCFQSFRHLCSFDTGKHKCFHMCFRLIGAYKKFVTWFSLATCDMVTFALLLDLYKRVECKRWWAVWVDAHCSYHFPLVYFIPKKNTFCLKPSSCPRGHWDNFCSPQNCKIDDKFHPDSLLSYLY